MQPLAVLEEGGDRLHVDGLAALVDLLRGLEDAAVGQLDAGDEAVLLVATAMVHLVGPGPLRIFFRHLEEVAHRFHGELGGDLPGSVATHAICDQVETMLGEDGEAVFVMLPFASDVGLTGDFDSQRRRHFSAQS